MSEIKQKTPYELGVEAGKSDCLNHADTRCPDFSDLQHIEDWEAGYDKGFMLETGLYHA